MRYDADLIVAGSGFGGSLMAMLARRLGFSVALLERQQHPRFAIGESSTPLANALLEELGRDYDLPCLASLSKWGTWQRDLPRLPVGLKRGFSFLHHRAGEAFGSVADRRNELLVGASPSDELGDTHWYRPSFDHFLVNEAQQLGAVYLDQYACRSVRFGPGSVVIEGTRGGKEAIVRGRYLLDATGPRGLLHRLLGLEEKRLERLPGTQALFNHFEGVARLTDLGLHADAEKPPYPVDDAALHHVFEGGWMWVLRFNNGITSAGVAFRDEPADQLKLREGAAAWARLLQMYPTVGCQFQAARALLPFIHQPRLAFQSAQLSGPDWALLPSAAGFIDPLMSTGFALTLLGIRRLARALRTDWGTPRFSAAVETYARETVDELLAAELLVAALYAAMGDPVTFNSIALLYFAAVSYLEITGRRQGIACPEAFLLHDHPHFGPRCRRCCEDAIQGGKSDPERAARMERQVLDAIRPMDLIGLSEAGRRNWHPVRA